MKSRDYHVTKGLTKMMMMENNLFSKTFLSTHYHSNFIILSWPHFKSFWSENWVPRLIFDEEHDAEVRKLLSLLVLAVQKNRIQRLTSHPHPNPNYSINYYTLPLLFLQKSWVVKKYQNCIPYSGKIWHVLNLANWKNSPN